MTDHPIQLPPDHLRTHGIDIAALAIMTAGDTDGLEQIFLQNRQENSCYTSILLAQAYAAAGNLHLAEYLMKCAALTNRSPDMAAWVRQRIPTLLALIDTGRVPVSGPAVGSYDRARSQLETDLASRVSGFLEFGTDAHRAAEDCLVALCNLLTIQLGLLPFDHILDVDALMGPDDVYSDLMAGYLERKRRAVVQYNLDQDRTHLKRPSRTHFFRVLRDRLVYLGKPQVRILDYGSADGANIDDLGTMLAKHGVTCEIHCVDPSAEAIARMRDERPHLHGLVGDEHSLAALADKAPFDLMIASSVFLLCEPSTVEAVLAFAGRTCDAVAILDHPSNFAGHRPLPRANPKYIFTQVVHDFRTPLSLGGFDRFEMVALPEPVRSYPAGMVAARGCSPLVP